uniref:Mitochondrial ribosomal protein S14 n=1 Tax=Mus musculus TaxID=10090 RepID=M0QWY3_MOUSE
MAASVLGSLLRTFRQDNPCLSFLGSSSISVRSSSRLLCRLENVA